MDHTIVDVVGTQEPCSALTVSLCEVDGHSTVEHIDWQDKYSQQSLGSWQLARCYDGTGSCDGRSRRSLQVVSIHSMAYFPNTCH